MGWTSFLTFKYSPLIKGFLTRLATWCCADDGSAVLQKYLQSSEKAVRRALEAERAAGPDQLLQLRPDGCPSTLTAAAVFPVIQGRWSSFLGHSALQASVLVTHGGIGHSQ